MHDRSHIANEVRWRRRAHGWTQQSLADRAQVSRRLVSQLERGKPTLRMDGVERVLAALGARLEVAEAEESAEGRPAPEIVPLVADPRTMAADELITLFRRRDRSDVDVNERGLLRSVLMWLHDAIQRGERPPVGGNVRALWYEYAKPTLAGLPGVALDQGYEAMVQVLSKLVFRHGLVRYSDFGLTDENWEHRRIGDRCPGVILYAEQTGWFRDLRQVHQELGCTVSAWQGNPSGVTSEYTARHVLEATRGDPRVHLIGITDWDPAGDLAMAAYAQQLTAFGVRVQSNVRLVRPLLYTAEERALHAFPLPAGRSREPVNREWVERTGGTDGEPRGLSSQVLDFERFRLVAATLVAGAAVAH